MERTGKTALWLEFLLFKYKGLSSDPQNPHKKSHVAAHIYKNNTGGGAGGLRRDRQIEPGGLPKLQVSGFSEKPNLTEQVK